MEQKHQEGRRAIVIGGSMAGLFAASLLRGAGWEAHLFERSPVELAGRGAGIVTHEELLQVLRECGAGTRDLGVTVRERIALDRSGAVIARLDYEQVVTSWDRLHFLLRATLPADCHHLGHDLADIEQDEHGVTAVFADGRRERADLLVGADGFRSAVRRHCLPQVQPQYAGYVVWRGIAPEAALPADVHAAIFGRFSFFLPDYGEVIAYPIAGPGNDLRPGHRRLNWVWYRRVEAPALQDMLTDDEGRRHELSIPPPRVRAEVVEAMKADARALLPHELSEPLRHMERPFFTPIYDHCSPAMAFGRIALVGDAAAVGRPHIGMGVTKAAGDARSLAACIAATQDVPAALRQFQQERLPIARRAVERGRELGEYMHHTEASLAPALRARWRQLHSVPAMLRHTASADFLRPQAAPPLPLEEPLA
jgi:2-polyprenyl-6-methoxyphenol hydroxylase-like FAD-dependent oxidoreductase